jgi:methionine-R-sulfoxide reductase
MVIYKDKQSSDWSGTELKAVLVLSAVMLASACGSGPTRDAEAATVPEKTAGGITMPIVKAADAANVCYIEPTEELKAKLTPEQFAVLVESATEPPFRNAYWDNHEQGIYVDAIDGVPLFASAEKFDSGTGWPSFWAPIDPDKIMLVEDVAYGMRRIEVRSKASGGHLGHLFDDGPNPTGLRYCINSASLRFIPREKLAAEGYAELASLFTQK